MEDVLFICYEIFKKIRSKNARYAMGHMYELEFYNLCGQKKDYNMCMHLYRKICLFELHREKCTNKRGEFTFFLSTILNKKVTSKAVETFSDETLIGVVRAHLETSPK